MTQVSLGHRHTENEEDNNFMPGITDEMLLRQLGFEVQNDDELDYDFTGLVPSTVNLPKRARRVGNSPMTGLNVESLDRTRGHASTRSSSAAHMAQSPVSVIDITSDTEDEDDPLPKVLELFPDISQQYVKDLFARHKPDQDTSYEKIIEEILANPSYPKQKELKRKRTVTEDDKDWESGPGHHGDTLYLNTAARILAQEFPHVPTQYIRQVMDDKQRLYTAYLYFSKHESTIIGSKPYERLKRARKAQSTPTPFPELLGTGSLTQELDAAKKKAALAVKKNEEEEAERLNEEEHTKAGTLVECQCCYSDVPSNRTVPCEGMGVHFFCFACIRRSADTQIGLMKYQLQCMDTSGCQASFTRLQLQEVLGASIMKKLETLQQQDEIARAGLDGLESCPFCDFKAICPPVEEDREFRCSNPECEMITCRICNEESHIPKTCEEAKKERGVSERHHVEEAMSEALIRSCPKCKVKIVKEMGCNKMTCPQCRCMMCYICKKDISREQYGHFGRGCNVNDDPRQNRYQQEVEQAEKKAIEKVRAENPHLTQEELRVYGSRKDSAKENPSRPARQLQTPQIPGGGNLYRVHGPQHARRRHGPMPPLPAYPEAGPFPQWQPHNQGMPNWHQVHPLRHDFQYLNPHAAAAARPQFAPNSALSELSNQIAARRDEYRRRDNATVTNNDNTTTNNNNNPAGIPRGPVGLLANRARPTAANFSAATQPGVPPNGRPFTNQADMTVRTRRTAAAEPFPAEQAMAPFAFPHRTLDIPRLNFADHFFGQRDI
ncbi:hypothetical protein AWENTII_007701 [Aspergillus wentii]